MGVSGSSQTRFEYNAELLEAYDTGERYFGYENFGNTCYCNSVLQALYFCAPLRLHLERDVVNDQIKIGDVRNDEENGKYPPNSILFQLSELFRSIKNMKKLSGCIAPNNFLRVLRERNELFQGNMQQDAHEFYNFIINDMADTLTGIARCNDDLEKKKKTWIHDLFEGVLTNETRCICCDSVTQRDESFMDLSLDIEQNSSVNECLKNFSRTETLTSRNKFFCENCFALQEAEKRMCLRKLPRILTLHLKRFKYSEELQNFSKLSHRVAFSLQLKVPNMSKDNEDDAELFLYQLFAVVVHIGRGPNHGHYVAIVKSNENWILFDDDLVEVVNESILQHVFGLSNNTGGSTNTGYLLFYDSGEGSSS